MNREKAIEILENLLDCSYVDAFEDEEKDAIKIAIKSLKTYPCNWHFENIISICDYCEFKSNQSARCLDCPAILIGNKEK